MISPAETMGQVDSSSVAFLESHGPRKHVECPLWRGVTIGQVNSSSGTLICSAGGRNVTDPYRPEFESRWKHRSCVDPRCPLCSDDWTVGFDQSCEDFWFDAGGFDRFRFLAGELQLDDDHLGRVEHCDSRGQRQLANVDRVTELQSRDVDADAFRNRGREALDVQFVQRLVEHAAAGGFRDAAEFDLHLDLDRVRRRDAEEVEVGDVLAEVVELQVLDEDRFLLAGDVEFDGADFEYADGVVEFLEGDRDLDGLFAVAVDDTGDAAGLAELAGKIGGLTVANRGA